MSATTKPMTLSVKVMTYNVNHSRRATGDYGAYSFDKRAESVRSMIVKHAPDVLLLQEIPVESSGSFLGSLPGYCWHTANEPGRGGNFTQMVIGVDQCLTKPGDGTGSAKIPCGNFITKKVGDTLYVCVHAPMDKDERFSVAAGIAEVIREMEVTRWVIGGDFNSFPDDGGFHQMDETNHVLNTRSVSDNATAVSNGKLAMKSFKPYPYDFVDPDALDLHGKLDHILVHGFRVEHDDDDKLKCVVDDTEIKGKNWHPSDHFPVIVGLNV